MTLCTEARGILAAVAQSQESRVDPTDVAELVSLGLLARAEGAAPHGGPGTDLGQLKAQLGQLSEEVSHERTRLAALSVRDRSSMKELEERESRLRVLRTRYLDAMHSNAEVTAQATLNGEPYSITYKGREALAMLAQRHARVSRTGLREFLVEMQDMRRGFEERAQRAREALEILSPKLPKVDEIHLRSAAVGLAGRPGTPSQAVNAFIEAYELLPTGPKGAETAVVTLAETIAVSSGTASDLRSRIERAAALVKEPWRVGYVLEDQMRATGIIISAGGDTARLVERTVHLTGLYCPGWPSACALLACAEQGRTPDPVADGVQAETMEDVLDQFRWLRERLYREDLPAVDLSIAAALMAASGQDVNGLFARFGAANALLHSLDGGHMEVPAAMVALLPVTVDEAMDDVRLAAAAVMARRLSLGAMENLSLGMKMLLQSSLLQASTPSALPMPMPAPHPVLAGAAVAAASAAAVGLAGGYTAFHEYSMHRHAVRYYHIHPTHSHYVYG